MTKPRILAFSGSTRKASFNGRLISLAVDAVRDAGGDATLIGLEDYPMPIFNQDDEREHGLPESTRQLKKLFREHDGLLISAPEYNSSITPLLKNTLDWVSRKEEGQVAMTAYSNKSAALLSASPGRLGGLRGLVHVRAVLVNLGVLVLPGQLSVAKAGDAFDESGALTSDFYRDTLKDLMENFVATASALKTA